MKLTPKNFDQEEFYDLITQIPLISSASVNDRIGWSELITIWLTRAMQIGDIEQVRRSFDRSIFSKIFIYICDNWSDANSNLYFALRNLFKKLVLSKIKIYPELEYTCWVSHLLSLPPDAKAVYYVLEILGKYLESPFSCGLGPPFYRKSFDLMKSLDYANPVSRCLVSLFYYSDRQSELDWLSTWSPFVYEALPSEAGNNVIVYFVPSILAQKPSVFPHFLENLPVCDHSITIGCLKAANGLVDVLPYLKDDVVDNLHSRSRNLRRDVLSLLLSSQQTSSPISGSVYNVLRKNVSTLFSEANAKFRAEIYGIFRQFIFRIRASTYTIHKKDGPAAQEIVEARSFCQWFVNYLTSLLGLGSPYRCLVTACQYLECLIVSGLDQRVDSQYFETAPVPFVFSVDIYTNDLVHQLMNHVSNNYHDIRKISAYLLSVAPKPISFFDSEEKMRDLAKECEKLLSGVRERQADGGARIANLIYLLHDEPRRRQFLARISSLTHKNAEAALENLELMAISHGIHGYFTTLSLILQNVKPANVDANVLDQVLDSIIIIWRATKSVLICDAPEGSNPLSFDDAVEDEPYLIEPGPAGRNVLSFAWRSVKEAMNLLSVILRRFDTLSDATLLESGNLLVEQLTTIRHRGAFASVAPAFQACYERFYASETLKSEPKKWFMQHLTFKSLNSQSITRRSAGLPYLVCGFLAALPKTEAETTVAEVFNRLYEIAKVPPVYDEEENRFEYPQVHALNCIKAGLRDARLNKWTVSQLEPSLSLSLNLFKSKVWSIRNCGIMLFSALYTRMFGSRKAIISASLFFTRFKSSFQLCLNHLECYVDSGFSEDFDTVYPVLSILLRLRDNKGDDRLKSFVPPLRKLLGCPYWKVREMAARVLASVTAHQNTSTLAIDLLTSGTLHSQNELHGFLLTLNHLELEKTTALKATALRRFPDLFEYNACYETKLEFMKFFLRLGLNENAEIQNLQRLNPSCRIMNGLIVQSILHKDRTRLKEFLVCQEKESQLACLDCLDEYPDNNLVKELLKLLSQADDTEVLSRGLDVLEKHLKISRSGFEYDDVSCFLDCKNSLSIRRKAIIISGLFAANADNVQFLAWCEDVVNLASDSQPTSARFAALRSIDNYLFTAGDMSDTLLYTLFLSLSDDEEEVRDFASEIAGKVLGVNDWSAAYCQLPILRKISKEFLIKRVRGEETFDRQVREALKVDSSLFAVEKDNLYRYDIGELRLISEVVGTFPKPSEDLSQSVALLAEKTSSLPFGLSSSPEIELLTARIQTLQLK